MLHYRFHQAKIETPKLLVMLHGFISDQQAFDHHINNLSEEMNIVTIDLPGHGQDMSDMNETWNFTFINQQLDETLEALKTYQLFLHGYSMGGRVALHYAIYGNIKLNGLILESTSPGIEEQDVKIERQQIDYARAKVLEIAGLDIFVNDWEKLPLFYTQYDLDKETRKGIRDMRLRQDPERLAKALRDYGTGNMPNLWPEVANIDLPTCIMVGDLDAKFSKVGKQLESLIKKVELHEISNSGHTIHVEDAKEFDRIVIGFIHKEEQND